jgi:DNA-binding transcriptional LysR family regulator
MRNRGIDKSSVPSGLSNADVRLGRRVTFRDLQILFSVVQLGSMAKAATQLSVTQPTVSQAIADLEDAVGVRLLDRSPQGVTPTAYGEAFLKRGLEAFDALRQGMRDIERLATPGAGDIWIGSAETWLGGFVPTVIRRLAENYPAVVIHAAHANASDFDFLALRERKLDLMIGRILNSQVDGDMDVEVLFEEPHRVVVAAHNPWTRHRRVTLADLKDERWIFSERSNIVTSLVSEAFRAKGLDLPAARVVTTSMILHLPLLAAGDYITTLPYSILRYCLERWSLNVLPIELGIRSPVGIFTLKQRTLSPVVQLFIEAARAEAKLLQEEISKKGLAPSDRKPALRQK